MKKFTRTIEDFACEHCGTEVEGNGYTNHCPECLWSKHVDINPGDRAHLCGGLMKPREIESGAGEYKVVHECVKCGFVRKNKVLNNDNFKEVIKISERRPNRE